MRKSARTQIPPFFDNDPDEVLKYRFWSINHIMRITFFQ